MCVDVSLTLLSNLIIIQSARDTLVNMYDCPPSPLIITIFKPVVCKINDVEVNPRFLTSLLPPVEAAGSLLTCRRSPSPHQAPPRNTSTSPDSARKLVYNRRLEQRVESRAVSLITRPPSPFQHGVAPNPEVEPRSKYWKTREGSAEGHVLRQTCLALVACL